MRVAARRDEQQRAPARAVQLVVVDLDGLAREVREHRQRIAELARVGAASTFVESRPRSSI